MVSVISLVQLINFFNINILAIFVLSEGHRFLMSVPTKLRWINWKSIMQKMAILNYYVVYNTVCEKMKSYFYTFRFSIFYAKVLTLKFWKTLINNFVSKFKSFKSSDLWTVKLDTFSIRSPKITIVKIVMQHVTILVNLSSLSHYTA